MGHRLINYISRRIYLKEGPYIKVAIYNTTKNTTTPL